MSLWTHWERTQVQVSFSGLPSLLSLSQQLEEQAELTPAVDVIPLPGSSDFTNPGMMCWAAGWGKTGETEPTSDTLREVELRIMDKEDCKKYSHYDNNFQVCVGSPTTLKTAYMVSTHLHFLRRQHQRRKCPKQLPMAVTNACVLRLPLLRLWELTFSLFLISLCTCPAYNLPMRF